MRPADPTATLPMDRRDWHGNVYGTIAKAERQIQPLLAQHRRPIQPAATPIRTLRDLRPKRLCCHKGP